MAMTPDSDFPPSSSLPAPEEGWSVLRLVGTAQRKWWLLAVASLATGAGMVVKNAQKVPEYQGSFRLLVEPVRDQEDLTPLTETQPSTTAQKLDYSTQIEVMLSPDVLDPILERLGDRYPNTTYESVIGKLSVNRLGETKLLEVRYSDTNADKAKAVLEQVSQGYLEYSLASQRSQLMQGIAFVDEKLPDLQERVASLETQLQFLQQKYAFSDPKNLSEGLSQQLTSITGQRQTLSVQFIAARAEYEALLQASGQNQALGEAQNYQALQQEYQSLQQQIAIESARLGRRNPSILLLQRQQENLAPILQQEAQTVLDTKVAAIKTTLDTLSQQDQELANQERSIREKLQVMPAVLRTYNQLQRELEMATTSLTRFQETKEALQIRASQNEIPWELTNPPNNVKQKPTTGLPKVLLTGLIMGAGLGLALAIVLEKLANTYYTSEEIKKRVPLPVLGVIPLHPDLEDTEGSVHVVDLRKQTMIPESLAENLSTLKANLKTVLSNSSLDKFGKDANHPFAKYIRLDGMQTGAEAPPATEFEDGKGLEGDRWLNEYDSYRFLESFRALHGNLLPLPVRSIVLTSPLPGEGATTVAVHLVQAASAMGRRVLLVDAQFRRGGTRLNDLLGIRREAGLSDYLTNKAGLNEVIQRLSWESNLYAISSGSEVTDPTRLLSSPRMPELIERLDKVFDLVVYSMPPLMGLADVGLVAGRTDGVLLVTSVGRRQSITGLNQTLERLKLSRISVLGLVVNRVKDHSVDLYAHT